MGGIVARLAMLDEDASQRVQMVLTMSTPHLLPPITLERRMDQLYNSISQPLHYFLVSICGGVSDTQIVSDSCNLTPHLVGTSSSFSVFTTAIPAAWTGVDHQAMVWCHQVRWRIARVLLDTIGAPNKEAIARLWFTGRRHQLQSGISIVSGSSEIASPCEECAFETIPRLKAASPFPLPGEGVQSTDVQFVVEGTEPRSRMIVPGRSWSQSYKRTG